MGVRWERYVKRLCERAWDLDAVATDKVLNRISALASAGDLTDAAVSRVLRRAGVSTYEADFIAPSIRVAIGP